MPWRSSSSRRKSGFAACFTSGILNLFWTRRCRSAAAHPGRVLIVRYGNGYIRCLLMSIIPFDDRDGFIWMDGAMRTWRDANIHVLTHGLHYASAVFEGERAYGGRV